jgi:hypothetical protein
VERAAPVIFQVVHFQVVHFSGSPQTSPRRGLRVRPSPRTAHMFRYARAL